MVVEKTGSSAQTSASARSRGRPTLGTAAQIDREILDAAREQFLAHGFGQTSMAMIIKAAGVSKTTLYARYATKADLFRAIVRRTIEQYQNTTLRPGAELTQDLVEGLNLYGVYTLRIGTSPVWANYERLVYSEGPRFPELAHSITERVQLAFDNVARFISQCAQRDGIVCVDAYAVARSYILALRGFQAEAILSVRDPGMEEIERFVSELVRTLVAPRAAW